MIVVAVLHSKGGEGPQWQQIGDVDAGLLQEQEQSGNVVCDWRVNACDVEPSLKRVASGLTIEQHAITKGLMHHGAGLLGAAEGFTSGMEHQVDRQIGLRHCTPQIAK